MATTRRRHPETEEETIVKQTHTETVIVTSEPPSAAPAPAPSAAPNPGPTALPPLNTKKSSVDATDCDRSAVCDDPCTQAWKTLQQSLIANPFSAADLLAQECVAAARLIGRFLKCHESEASTMAAIRGTIGKIATMLEFGNEYNIFENHSSGYEDWLRGTQAALQNLCFLMAPGDSKGCAPCGPAGTDTRSSNFIQIMELERISEQLSKMVPATHSLLHSDSKADGPGLAGAVTGFVNALQAYRAAFIGCDDQNLSNTLQALRSAAAAMTRAYDDWQCRLRRAQCTMQPMLFDKLQADADCFGFLAANALRAVNRLSHAAAGVQAELVAVWTEMAAFLNGPVKRAFKKYEQHELCPQTLCFDTATAELGNVIAAGLVQAQAGTFGIAGIDDGAVLQQRQYIDQAVCAISRLDCKNLEGFDRCVWTRLGAFTMRLYAILNRNSVAIADQVRNLYTSWQDLQTWFNGKMVGDPPPAAMHLLEAGIRAAQSLVAWAQNQGVTVPAARGSALDPSNLGQLQLQLVGQNNQPLPNYSVMIQPQAGGTPAINRVSGPTGLVTASVPAGPYVITDTTGAELLTLNVTPGI